MHKYIVVGLGNISKRHRSNIKAFDSEAYVISVSSRGVIPDVLPCNCDRVVASIEEIDFESVKLAVVASPATKHIEHTLSLLDKKVPVLVEKPLACDINDAQKLVDYQIHKPDSKVAVAYCLRYMSSLTTIREVIASGRLGKLQKVNIEVGQDLATWRPNINYQKSVSANSHLGGGVLMELSHEFDYCMSLFGDLTPVFSIMRSSNRFNIDVEDEAQVTCVAADNLLINIQLDFLQVVATRTCRIVGSEGTLEWDLLTETVVEKNKCGSITTHAVENCGVNVKYDEMLRDFVAYCDGSQFLGASIEDGIKVLKLITNIKSNAVNY